ncbi:MAG: PBP1A family penicillin-binding protein [Armatimonadetes bacterium]|nr:PBP1A family penicillin-binding protein [Armatimonadota bacterium]
MILLGLGFSLAAGTAAVAVLNHFSKGLPDVSRLRFYEPSETTRIYSADGQLIATLFKENRTWTPIDEVSPHLLHAVLAIEDSRFYEHRGVDPVGVARAAYYDYVYGDAHQGASTITMQLARNLFLSPTRSMERKIKEALLAVQIEKKFTKDEILELYVNQIYFGAGAYGVEAAARTYFNKKARDLTPAEASLIAGLPQAPSQYSPFVDQRASGHRQILVLGRMVHLGYLSWDDYRQALNETLHFNFKKKQSQDFQILEVPYFTTFVLKELYSRYDENLLYRGGLKIYTTVDVKLQKQAEAIVRDMIGAEAYRLNVDNAALVCVENKTGFIRAMVGGTRWSEKNQFNRAWQARRQPGSAFKIFVYTTAIEAGYNPETIVPDTPITFKLGPTESWSPKNSDLAYMGAVPLKTALQYSRNVVAVKLLTMVGPEQVIDYAYRMGIKERLYPHLSLALGAVEVSPLEMAGAFSVLPNGGVRVEPTPIKIIYDSDGNVVEDHTFARQEEVLSEATAQIMVEMMKRVVESGTGTSALLPGYPVAGKTGTTDSFKDAWFVGFTPQLTAAVWVGNDNNEQMVRSFGGDLPARIWQRFMLRAMDGQPKIGFQDARDGKISVIMCTESKKRANAKCPGIYREFYPAGGIPAFCDHHGKHARAVLPGVEVLPLPESSPLPGQPANPLSTPEPLEQETQAGDPLPNEVDYDDYFDSTVPEAIPAPPTTPTHELPLDLPAPTPQPLPGHAPGPAEPPPEDARPGGFEL